MCNSCAANGLLALTALCFASVAVASPIERLWSGDISTAKTEINYQLTDSETVAVFARAEADYSLGKIYLVNIEDERLRSVKRIGFSDERYKDSDPWLSPSGNELYFISDRPSFVGDVRDDSDDYDLWRARRSGTHWTAPEHLGSLNSGTGEFGPELHQGFLYFSSQRNGRYQLFRARQTRSGFADAELLPQPFNGPALNSDLTLSRGGQVALWWSTRPGGYGSGDLYVSRRSKEGWTKAQNLGESVNSPYLDFTPSLSPNQSTLFFATNRPYPGQDQGASDVYRIPVVDVPELRAALATATLERLTEAFGGVATLSRIKTLSYRLEIDRAMGADEASDVFLNFESESIAERVIGDKAYRTAGGAPGASHADSARQDQQDEDMLASLYNNFLFYLTAEDLELKGPEDIRGHSDLVWFRLAARGQTSPLLGIDPATGRILKVLADGGIVVLELDYLRHESGLVWPYQFLVVRGEQAVLEGRFSNLSINAAKPDEHDTAK
ncbi:MAG: hypothetical protein AAFY29_15345 [Pseudomonadota bacterium]